MQFGSPRSLRLTTWVTLAIASSWCWSCEKPPDEPIRIDGSSTVFPLTKAVAESFQKREPVKVEVAATHEVALGISGTGGGFKLFCRGTTDISNASRPIAPKEQQLCAEGGVGFVELPIAFDALAVVVSARNTWARDLTTAELKRIWSTDARGGAMRWSDIRTAWPETIINLYGAGEDSGTRDFFAEAIVGATKQLRNDYSASEDDDVLVERIAADPNALGFFSFAYVHGSDTRVRALAIDDGDPSNGSGPVEPSPENVHQGIYQPLSRPLFIYINSNSLKRREVELFVAHYLTRGSDIAQRLVYVPLSKDVYVAAQRKVIARRTGSSFGAGVKLANYTVEQSLDLEPR